MDDAAAAMRAALPRTWYPFFARFPRPTPVQIVAWQPLLAGRDCLVGAPTATGKTEAVVAPLVERHIPPGVNRRGPVILIVSPTRALVNDLLRRLREPLTGLNLRVDRRTGDHAVLQRENPPHVLVTTPESLDSLLVRHTGFLARVRAVVLDELHILDGSARGDQLSILLARLRALVRRRVGDLQAVAASATLHAPEEVAGRYLRDPVVLSIEGRREIEVDERSAAHPAELLATLGEVWGSPGARKILVFVGRRADVEELTHRARRDDRLGRRVYAHHGSLSRAERERVERRFLADPSAICFATMTLELGIDIGDVDLVALASPPASVAGFLQRIGRGNRRTGRVQVLAGCADEGDRVRFRHLETLARRGDLCAEPYLLRPSVLVQQTGSLLLQSPSGWLTPAVLRTRLPAHLHKIFSEQRLRELFRNLVDSDWLAAGRGGHCHPGPQLHRAFERLTLHANLAAPGGDALEVVDEHTGQSLGIVAKHEESDTIAIAGRTRQVLRQHENRVYVRDDREEHGPTPFSPRGRQLVTREMARSLAQYLDLRVDRLPRLPVPEGAAVLHFQGSLAGELLGATLQRLHGWPVLRGAAYAIIVEEMPADGPVPVITAEDLRTAAGRIGAKLARLTGAGPYHRYLPQSWRTRFLDELAPYETIALAWSRTCSASPKPEQAQTLRALARVR